jgi:hypothetical protein
VPAGDDPIGDARQRGQQFDLEYVAGFSALDEDRTSHDVWPVRVETAHVPSVRLGYLDTVGQDVVAPHALAGEPGQRVPPLVLEQTFVADRVDGHGSAR